MQVIPPPLPAWEGIHPLVVHFPIALLMVAPVFVLLGILLPRRGFSVSALVLMLMGVAGAWVATSSGEAAHSVMDQTMSMDDWELYEEADYLAQAHKVQTENARNVFTGLTLLYAVVLGTGALASSWRGRVIPQLVVLLAWAPALGYLSNAAHSGGELVHRFGVRALLPEEEPAEPEEEADAESPPADSDTDKDPEPKSVETASSEPAVEVSPTEPPAPAAAESAEEPPEPTGPGDDAQPAAEPVAQPPA